jgi:Fur family ferric uptake transcriptional regulator
MTGQRQVILEELRKVTVHPTADEVFAMVRKIMPHISLATVYRNLEILSSLGLVQKLECAGNQRRYDGNPRRHHHIRCCGCGSVSDVADEAVTEFSFLPDRIPGYRVLNYSFMFIGVCDECRVRGINPVTSLEQGEEGGCGDGID